MAAKLVLVGGGKMGGALLAGLVGRGWAGAAELAVVEPDAGRRGELEAAHPGLVVVDALSADLLDGASGALLAVKPDQAEPGCRQLAACGATRVLSVVAGIPSQRLELALGGTAVVVRAMPNTPALVGQGATVISGGSRVTAADLDWAEGILSAVGLVVRLPERYLDAVTGLSGSGPAYLLVVVEALIEAGVLVGLPREVSRSLTVQTLAGVAEMLARTGEAPESLRAAVTSPGGTTAAGLRALESRSVRAAFLDAVVAATERSRQLAL